MKKIVIGLSGGMDSTTLLGMLLNEEYEVHCCNFQYGSKHNKWEAIAVEKIIEYYKELGFHLIKHTIDVRAAFKDFESDLLLSGGEIPEGHYNDENMKNTVVPGRNMIFTSIMAGLAESIGAEGVALGVHQGDHHIYPDCRREFIKALDSAVYLSSDKKIEIFTPLLDEDKTSILKIGYDLRFYVPYHLTRTCYKNQEDSCGKCGSCQERLEAFRNIKIADPIRYDI
jgi:7-cyano-7-deazaguanine synthase